MSTSAAAVRRLPPLNAAPARPFSSAPSAWCSAIYKPDLRVRESLRAAGGAAAQATVLGILSLVFSAVVLVVALKYVLFVMRADIRAKGGTMELISLALPAAGRLRSVLLTIGLGCASLFFGDAMITPAISVLSAIERVQITTPALKPYVVPVAAGVLIALFAIQSRGSGRMGRLFGPIMAAWFVVLAIAGIVHLAAKPEILVTLNPRYALGYVAHADGWVAFTVLGSVFLALTGGEALYADMGHFGRRAIRIDWFSLVMPAFVLNYFGQGALVLSDPAAASDPFFFLFPHGLLVAVVVLTTAVIFRRLRPRAAGHSARRCAAAGGTADICRIGRSGLFTSHQLAAADRGARAGSRLPQLGRPCQRLWHRGGRRHAGHLHVGRDGGPRGLAMALASIAARRQFIPRDRRNVRLGQPA